MTYTLILTIFFRNDVRSNDKLIFFIMLILKLITQKIMMNISVLGVV